jgi:hypothetical protein
VEAHHGKIATKGSTSGSDHSIRLSPSTATLFAALLLVTPAGAASYTLPPQPPGTGNLVFWIDHKTNQNFSFYDSVWNRTVAMLEDMTGNGNGLSQTNKVQQPLAAPSGGAFFGRGTFLPSAGGDMLAGAGQVTLGFAFTLSSHYSGSAPRILFDLPNPNATAQHQLEITVTGGAGAGARRVEVTVQPNGGNRLATSTAGTWSLAPDIKHTLVLEVNLAANPATVNLYVDGLVYGGSNAFTSTQSAFAGTPSGALYLGNSTTANAPLTGTLDGALGYLSIDPAERVAVISYLGGL